MSGPVWSLKGIAGEFQGNTLPLKPPLMTIGRTQENHIMITDNNVSRHHASIFLNNEKIQIMDEKSRNGISINEKKIAPGQRVTLKHGDRIQIGPHGFVLEMDDDARFNPTYHTKTKEMTTPPKQQPQETDHFKPADDQPRVSLISKLKNFKPPQIEWNRRSLMYAGLGFFVLVVIVMQIPSSNQRPAQRTSEPTANVQIKSSTDDAPVVVQDSELDTLKAKAKASLQFQDYLAATEDYEKIVKAAPQDEYAKTQYEFAKKKLKRQIESHLENAKREYEKLNYERAIIEWKQVMALTFRVDPDVYKQTEEKIRDAEKEIRKRR